ncbi:MAG: glycosyltransferase [Sphingomonas sp.]|nr:MAG: glycosyltransferase [Sphingomonas sp.]
MDRIVSPQTESRAAMVGVVMIGRNEGERLRRCIASTSSVAARVYVDSGSTDNSVAWARAQGVVVVELAVPPKFTAARARNAGLERLLQDHPHLEHVQMVDGDCELASGWLDAASAALTADPTLALVFGRRRERFPERSIYNAFCDDEWNGPVGEAMAAGGDVMVRVDALNAVGGYDPLMIAGEDPDMAIRLRKAGWRLFRIDHAMTIHDAAILRFGQWWRRTERAGHAFGELADRHSGLRAPDYRRQCRSIALWGGVLPAAVAVLLIAAIVSDAVWSIPAIVLALLWPLQMLRIANRRRATLPPRQAVLTGIFLVIGKVAETIGLARYKLGQWTGRRSDLIEYHRGPARG